MNQDTHHPPARSPTLPLPQAPLSMEEAEKVEVDIDPKSDRLQLMETFDSWHGADYTDLPLLIKVKVCLGERAGGRGRGRGKGEGREMESLFYFVWTL